jgi:hypothetical protein
MCKPGPFILAGSHIRLFSGDLEIHLEVCTSLHGPLVQAGFRGESSSSLDSAARARGLMSRTGRFRANDRLRLLVVLPVWEHFGLVPTGRGKACRAAEVGWGIFR